MPSAPFRCLYLLVCQQSRRFSLLGNMLERKGPLGGTRCQPKQMQAAAAARCIASMYMFSMFCAATSGGNSSCSGGAGFRGLPSVFGSVTMSSVADALKAAAGVLATGGNATEAWSIQSQALVASTVLGTSGTSGMFGLLASALYHNCGCSLRVMRFVSWSLPRPV